MNLAQRVNDHISAGQPKVFCDSCVSLAIGVGHQEINRVTMALATTGEFGRRRGICDTCGRERKIIWRQ